jgi:hypothetical protein
MPIVPIAAVLPARGELAVIKPPPLLELMIVLHGTLPLSVPLVK